MAAAWVDEKGERGRGAFGDVGEMVVLSRRLRTDPADRPKAGHTMVRLSKLKVGGLHPHPTLLRWRKACSTACSCCFPPPARCCNARQRLVFRGTISLAEKVGGRST